MGDSSDEDYHDLQSKYFSLRQKASQNTTTNMKDNSTDISNTNS